MDKLRQLGNNLMDLVSCVAPILWGILLFAALTALIVGGTTWAFRFMFDMLGFF